MREPETSKPLAHSWKVNNMARSKSTTKATLENVGFKIATEHWQAIVATAEKNGTTVADLFRAGAEAVVKKSGHFIWPEIPETTYKRGRPAKETEV